MERTSRTDRSVRRSLTLATVAGCLGMLYLASIGSPVTAQFFRSLGADEFHFGLLGGIPTIMLSMQFVGALIVNRLHRRKHVFIVLLIVTRALRLPIAFVPLLWPDLPRSVTLGLIIVLMATSKLLVNMIAPAFLSWMGDLIPRAILSTYWGTRQRWRRLCWCIAFLALSAWVYSATAPIAVVFAVITSVGVTLGIIDALLLIGVREPPNVVVRQTGVLDQLLAPLRHCEFRFFLGFRCAWAVSMMLAGAFMQLYLLQELGLHVWQTTLIWSVTGLGHFFASRMWGQLCDRYGSKPVLTFCTSFKSLIILAVLVSTPRTALFILPPAFLIDQMFNSGNIIAVNGYLLKTAPRKNRAMFVAMITALTGICMGLAAIGGGAFLRSISGFSVTWLGRDWSNFHVLFAISMCLRIGCAFLTRFMTEPKSASPMAVVNHLLNVWPVRILTFPVGLYRRYLNHLNGDS